jgi:hypothetical protein
VLRTVILAALLVALEQVMQDVALLVQADIFYSLELRNVGKTVVLNSFGEKTVIVVLIAIKVVSLVLVLWQATV